MTQNIGKTDRNIRLAAAGLLTLVGILVHQPLLSAVGLFMILTSTFGFCPLYAPFRFSTVERKPEPGANDASGRPSDQTGA